jgi:hypothetical protein
LLLAINREFLKLAPKGAMPCSLGGAISNTLKVLILD